MEQVWEDKKANIKKCRNLIKKCSKDSVNLIIFPEMTLTGFSMNSEKIAEPANDSETIKFFQKLCVENRLCVIFGLVISNRGQYFNSLIAVDYDGVVQASYEKIHLFTYANENQYYTAGKKLVSSKLESLKFGFTICYDLRFPELYSALSENCNVVVNIANWPSSRLIHWRILLQARAIENQIFMIGVNRIGIDANNNSYSKSSYIFDPNGVLLKPVKQNKEVDYYFLSEADKPFFPFVTRNDRKDRLYIELFGQNRQTRMNN